ncbi:MAG TPA: permease [bacterium]|nr:permease [bacterium]
MKDFLNSLIIVFMEMSPYLLLGFFIAGILNELFKGTKLKKYIGGNNFMSIFNASLLGVPLPLCSCGVIPTGVSLHKSGASKGSAVSFMISTPQTGVDSILVTWSLLGLPFAILRPVIAFITGVAGGVMTSMLEKNAPESNKISTDEMKEEDKRSFLQKFYSAMKYAFVDFLDDISLWLFIGLVTAALISVIIPDGFFTTYVGNNYLSMLIVLVASVPLYVCATSSVPIAVALMLKGLNPGAALVFLMAGPATNAATVLVIGKTLGKKALFSYLFSIIAGALISGAVIDNFFPAQWFVPQLMSDHSHNHEGINYLYIISSIILAVLLLMSFFRYITRKKEAAHCHDKECCCKNENKNGTQ